ncbi:radical SAM protein [Maricaulis sp. MIT060901]|uniref:radical SAM protein n=1 Tax=Maricaulis sp. MIT060901 TaxID=3096993 RepID=UPI0039997642
MDALKDEIRHRAASLPADAQIHHIHFGGGSPDMLSPDQFSDLMQEIRDAFPLATDAEIAAELDPRGVTRALATRLGELGFNRASLGVEDLSDEVQKLIHRIQPLSVVRQAVQNLREAGIAAINTDIMYGLPAQTVDRVEMTAHAVAELSPDRIAVFGYAHVPWFKKHQKAIPEDRLPGARERFEQMLAASSVLESHGYQPVGFDHFAKPDDSMAIRTREGRLCRNFQGYTDDDYEVLTGLGASSISEAPGGYLQNQPDPARYADTREEGRSSFVRGLQRDAGDRRIAARIERLMCDFELPLDPRIDLDAIADMQADGLVLVEDQRLQVPQQGRPYARNLAARIDPNFIVREEQHSRAI